MIRTQQRIYCKVRENFQDKMYPMKQMAIMNYHLDRGNGCRLI